MRRSALFVAAVLLAHGAFAYELSDVLSRLEKADKSVQSIQFDFVQDVQFTGMAASVIKGKASFAKPNRMRIEKQSPDKQITISNGKKMWVYNPAFAQVWEGTWRNWVEAKILPQGLVPIGGYAADLRKRFNLKLAEKSDGVRLIAQPKEDLGYTLEIVVSTQTWMPSSTVFRSDSAVVATALKQVVLNPAVKESDFRFQAPAGVDVIPLN